MKKQTKIILIIVAIVIVLYIAFEAFIFFSDKIILKEVGTELSAGNYDSAITKCNTLHYWRNSTCSSLEVAITVKQHPESKLFVCDGISIIYDGPWWFPMRQTYLDSLSQRKQTCISTLLGNHNLILAPNPA